MTTRVLPAIAGLLLLATLALLGWQWFATPPVEIEAAAPSTSTLPVPPVPPRLAQGRDYEQCLGMLDNDPAAAAGFAIGWEAVGGGDGARHCFALSRIATGHAAEGARLLEQLAGATGASAAVRAVIYGQASQAWLIEQEEQKAYDAATKALAERPDDIDILIDRAAIAAQLERYDEAVADLDRALSADPERGDAMTLRATANRHAGRLETASTDIAAALALTPDYPEALLERGIIRHRLGDSQTARADWERVIELAPDSAAADLATQNLELLDAGPTAK